MDITLHYAFGGHDFDYTVEIAGTDYYLYKEGGNQLLTKEVTEAIDTLFEDLDNSDIGLDDAIIKDEDFIEYLNNLHYDEAKSEYEDQQSYGDADDLYERQKDRDL